MPIHPEQEIPLPNGRVLWVHHGELQPAGAEPRPQLCTDGTPRRQLINGVYVDGTTVPCKQITIEGVVFDVVKASIGFGYSVDD